MFDARSTFHVKPIEHALTGIPLARLGATPILGHRVTRSPPDSFCGNPRRDSPRLRGHPLGARPCVSRQLFFSEVLLTSTLTLLILLAPGLLFALRRSPSLPYINGAFTPRTRTHPHTRGPPAVLGEPGLHFRSVHLEPYELRVYLCHSTRPSYFPSSWGLSSVPSLTSPPVMLFAMLSKPTMPLCCRTALLPAGAKGQLVASPASSDVTLPSTFVPSRTYRMHHFFFLLPIPLPDNHHSKPSSMYASLPPLLQVS